MPVPMALATKASSAALRPGIAAHQIAALGAQLGLGCQHRGDAPGLPGIQASARRHRRCRHRSVVAAEHAGRVW
jgi:hypothetical protein